MGSTYTTLSFEPPQTDPKETYLIQTNPTQNAWYTILNLSGSGYLHEVRANQIVSGNRDPSDTEIQFTIDGGTAQISSHDSASLDRIEIGNDRRFELHFQRVRFFTSLKVEIRSTRSNPGNLFGKVYYSQV